MSRHWTSFSVKAALIITLISALSACGFQLRGMQDVAKEQRQVTLIANNANQDLLYSLRKNMTSNGISESSNAPYQLQILNHKYNRRAATLRSNADVDEQEISVAVIMLIADQEGKPLTPDIRIQRERVYTYRKNAATASSEQESLLKQELYDSVAQSMIHRYLAASTPK